MTSVKTKLPSLVRGVFLDFDGVILESADLKRIAYLRLFPVDSKARRAIEIYHQKHAGLPRAEQIAHIALRILKRPMSAAQLKQLTRRYGQLVYQKTLKCQEVPGARAFLKNTTVPIVIVSGTPDDELDRIIRARGFGPFISEAHGSSQPKELILAKALRRFGWLRKETVFVGDARSDFYAARSCRIPFIGRVKKKELSLFPRSAPVVCDLKALARLLGRCIVNDGPNAR